MTRARAVLFGKLPAHGDFVARGLTPDVRAAWDDWTSAGLEQARQALGEAFEGLHDEAPPWRFVDGPGRFGPGWRAGALAPSVDSAGRRFLIMLAVDDLSASEASALGEGLAEAMEGLIYAGFEKGLNADGLAQAAADTALALPAVEDGPHGQARWWTEGGPRHAPQNSADAPNLRVALTPTPEEVDR